jgi:hypothetical protein
LRTDALGRGALSGTVVAVAVLLGQPDVVAQQHWDMQVDAPRPLAEAAFQVEAMCSCVVTYEDPRWTREQVVDVTAQVRQEGRFETHVFSPAGKLFEFRFLMPPSETVSIQLPESLRALLNDFHRSGNPGRFSITQSGDVYHVRPASGSVLDVEVSLPAIAADEAELIGALLRAVSAAQHTAIVMGTSDLGTRRFVASAANETAESVLTKLLTTRTPRRSWQLLYDFGSQRYVLNTRKIE